MKEIEIKLRVDNFESLKGEFKKRGIKLSKPISQKDVTFVNYEGDYMLFPKDANYLRIREMSWDEDGAIKTSSEFTLKRSLNNKDELMNIEKEIDITDTATMRDIIVYLGYHEAVTVHKVRQKAKYMEYEFCLDVVEGLGTFIEIEKMTDGDQYEAEKELLGVARDFGLDTEKRVMNGYDTLMYLQNAKKDI